VYVFREAVGIHSVLNRDLLKFRSMSGLRLEREKRIMMIKRLEVERFSMTSSKPFEVVVARFEARNDD
jgi:hypothetical protein